MPLIDITIPDEDGWHDILAARVLMILFAAFVLRFGLTMWGAAAGDNGLVGAIPTFIAFALGVELLVLAVADIDLERWGRPLGYGTTLLLAALALAVVVLGEIPRLGTDLLAFTSYAVEVIDAGGNPTAVSLAPAAALPGAPDVWTYRTDGSWATSWSYPTGTLWIYSIQYQLVGRWLGLRVTSLLGVVGIGWLITYLVPPEYGLLGPASLLIAQNEYLAALGGLNDMWYVLPTIATMWLWATERRVAAAAIFGVACAMKQQPWLICLPLAIWVWQDAPSIDVFARRAAAYIGVGGGVFLLFQLPWIVLTPVAWLRSALVPLSVGNEAPLVSMGVGLAILNQAVEHTVVGRATFEYFIYGSTGLATVAYWYWFEHLRWAAWLAPAAILLWAPRSLPSYFHWFVPIAIIGLFASQGALRGQVPDDATTAEGQEEHRCVTTT
jgi:hypothetical protein